MYLISILKTPLFVLIFIPKKLKILLIIGLIFVFLNFFIINPICSFNLSFDTLKWFINDIYNEKGTCLVKKVLFLLLTSFLVLGACGQKEDNKSDDKKSETTKKETKKVDKEKSDKKKDKPKEKNNDNENADNNQQSDTAM